MPEVKHEYQCSLQLASDVLGGKWKMRILWYLLDGTQRFSDLMKRIPDISQKALTEQLRELEAADIIERKVYAEIPPKVEYKLTDFGLRLKPTLCSLRGWAHDYAEEKSIDVLTMRQYRDEQQTCENTK